LKAVDGSGEPPSYFAVMSGNIDLVKLLMPSGKV
jgi:hypothetical protein